MKLPQRRPFADDDRNTEHVRDAYARPARPRLGYDVAPGPDARIKEAISRRLMDDPRLDASDIDVEVRDGVAILRGTAPGRCKRLAHDIAAAVPGVRDVTSELQTARFAA